MNSTHIPSPHAPKCWICDGILGSCGCGASRHPELFEATRKRLQYLDKAAAEVSAVAYDFGILRQSNGQLFLTAKTTVDQDENYVVAEISNYLPRIHKLSHAQVQTIMELACVLLNHATTIVTALEAHHKKAGLS